MKKIFLLLLFVYLSVFPSCLSQPENPCFPLTDEQTVCRDDRTINVLFDSVEGSKNGFTLKEYVIKHGIRHVNIHLLNGGGNVFVMWDYIDTINELKAMGVTIDTYARGVIASAAVPVFLMGEKRVMYENAFVMMHPGSWRSPQIEMYGGVPESLMKVLMKIEDRYARLVADKTKMSFDQAITILRGKDTNRDTFWLDAFEAFGFGFATEVRHGS